MASQSQSFADSQPQWSPIVISSRQEISVQEFQTPKPHPTSQQQQQPQQPSIIKCSIESSFMRLGEIPSSSSSLRQSQQEQPQQQQSKHDDDEESRMRQTYKTISEMDCIDMVTRSLDVILKDTYKNTFRQEIFNLLGVETSDDAAKQFKEKFVKLCNPGNNNNESNADVAEEVPTDQPI